MADELQAEKAATGHKARGERRLFRRYDLDLEARLVVGDRILACMIQDLSLGGAGLSPAMPALEGETVRLVWQGLELPNGLPARVVRATAGRTHVTFTLDEEAENALTMFLLTSAIGGQ